MRKFEKLHINFDEVRLEVRELRLDRPVVLHVLSEEGDRRFSKIENMCGKEDKYGYKKVKMIHAETKHTVCIGYKKFSYTFIS